MGTWIRTLALALGCAGALGCGDSDEGADRVLSSREGDVTKDLSIGNRVFDPSDLADYHLTIDPADWDSIIWDTRGDDYRHCTLRWHGVTLADVAVRPSGGGATRYPGNLKMGLKFDFNEFVPKQKLDGLKSLKLDGLVESTMMRERLSYDVYRAWIPTTPRSAHCRLFVNGEYWGLYRAEERVREDLLKHRYPGQEIGMLYRIWSGAPEAFTWRGDDPDLYTPRPWDFETHEEDPDHAPMIRFLDVLNHRPADLGTVHDLDNLVRMLALEAACISRDGLVRDAGRPQNHYEYHRPATGLFEFIPWDIDNTWSSQEATRSIYRNFDTTRIAAVVRDTPALDAAYRTRLRELVDTLTHPDVLAPQIDFIYAQIREAAHADPHKFATNAQFDTYPAFLKQVARDRRASILQQLQ
jgi:spore coat protein CotH